MKRPYVPLFDDINTSERLADLTNDSARLFYFLLLPQCDSWGRISAKLGTLNAKVWAILGRTKQNTESALGELVRVGMAEVHEADGQRWVQVTNWENKAGKVGRPERRGASRWPAPSDQSRLSRTDDGLSRTSDRLGDTTQSMTPVREQVGTEQSRAEQSRAEQSRREQSRTDTPVSPPDGAGVCEEPKLAKQKPSNHPRTDEIATALRDGITAWQPGAVPTTNSAASLRGISTMITVDGRHPDDALQLIEWLFHGGYQPRDESFDWRRNIRSGGKLRKQYDQLAEERSRSPSRLADPAADQGRPTCAGCQRKGWPETVPAAHVFQCDHGAIWMYLDWLTCPHCGLQTLQQRPGGSCLDCTEPPTEQMRAWVAERMSQTRER